MARPRKSGQQHWLAGNTPGYEGEAPTFHAGRPKMPADLPEPARAEWKKIVKLLSRRGTLTSVDSSALEVYVRMYAQWRALCAEVDKFGPMVDEAVLDKNGEVETRRVQNPAMKIALQLGNALRMYQKEFSATPASRERTKPTVPDPEKKKQSSDEGGDYTEESIDYLLQLQKKGEL